MPQQRSHTPYAQGKRQGRLVDDTLRKFFGSPPPATQMVPKPPAMGGPTPPVRMPQFGQRGAAPNQSLPALPVSRDPRSIMNPYGRSVAKGQQPRKTRLIPSGLIPKNPDQLFPYSDSESTKPITMDSLREREPNPQELTPSQIIQTSPAVTGKFMDDSVDSAGNPVRRSAANEARTANRRAITPELNKNRRQTNAAQQLLDVMQSNPLPEVTRPRDYFGEQRKNMEDLGMTELQPVAPGMATPQRPQVDESLLIRLPSRSERDRSSMQPGGMVSGDTFDAMAAREREERLAPQRALAQREDVASVDNRGFTRTVDRNPESPTYGQAKVEGSPMFGPSVPSVVQSFVTGNAASALPGRDKIEPPGNLWSKEGRPYRRMLNESREPRRKARLAGEVYTDPETGAVSDYGRFNEAREARQERKDAARELRTRRAQLMNYGRTGGVTVAPGGGIAGPMTVGTQATFGPNMSLNQATRMAQGQLDQESRLRDAEQRKQDAERTETLKLMAEQGDSQAADALREQVGLPVDPDRKVINKEIEIGGIMRGVPAMGGRTFSQVPASERNLMGLQVQSIINNPNLNDKQREIALREMYPELTTLAGINALQNNTENFDEFGPQEYLLTEELKRIMGIKGPKRAKSSDSKLPSASTNFPSLEPKI